MIRDIRSNIKTHFMDVSDSTGRVIHRLILNDSSTLHSITKNHYETLAAPPLETMDQIRNRSANKIIDLSAGIRNSLSMGPNNINLTKKDLWNKVQEIIMTFKETVEETADPVTTSN